MQINNNMTIAEIMQQMREGKIQAVTRSNEPYPINTKSFARLLETVGFTEVHRGAEKLSIHMDTKIVNLPDEMIGTSYLSLYYDIAMLVMEAQGYSDLSKTLVAGVLYKDKQMTKSRFVAWMPKLIAGMTILPKKFDEAVNSGMLRQIQLSSSPIQLSKYLIDLAIPRIPRADIVEGMFGRLTQSDNTVVDAPLENFVWLVNSGEMRDLLMEAGCNADKIWDVDRIVREVSVLVKVDTLGDLAKLVTNPVIEGDSLKIKVLNNNREVIIKYAEDPDPLPNDENPKVWSIAYQNQEYIFASEQYLDKYGPVPVGTAVWCMLQYVLGSSREDQITGRIALSAPSMFRQSFYSYAHGDEKIKTAVKQAVALWQITCNRMDLSPVLQEEINPEMVANAAMDYLMLGVPAIADAQVKRLYIKNGAIMRGFHLKFNEVDKVHYVVNCNDQSKPGKFTNRGGLMTNWQAYVYANGTNTYHHNSLKDEKMTYGAESILESSGFRLVGTNGVGIANDGIRCRVMISNWVLENGSGVVSTHPNFKMQIGVRKNIRFSEIAVFCEGVSPEDHLNNNFKHVDLKKSVKPGQHLAWFKGVPVCKFAQQEEHIEGYGISGVVVDVKLDNPTNIQTDAEKNPITYDISGSITVLMTYNETAAKMREAGCKWTCWQEELDIYDVDYRPYPQPDMVVGTENAKQDGNMLTLLKMWADSRKGGLDYNINTDLTPEQRLEFAEWRRANTKQLWIWTSGLQNVTFKAMLKEYGTRTDFMFDMDEKRVAQLCWVVEGDMVLSVEVSTVRENIGYQAVIAEQLAALACVYRPFAMELWASNVDNRDALYSVMDMAIAAETEDIWIKGATDNPVIPFDQKLLEEKGPRAVFKMLKDIFPGGLTISDNSTDYSGSDKRVVLKFDALERFSIGQDRVGNGVIMLLQHIALGNTEDLRNWDNVLSRRIGIVRGGISKWAVSRGNLKGMTRTDKVLHGRKIKPISRNVIKPGEVGLHPNDPLVREYENYSMWAERKIEKIMDEYYAGTMTMEECQEAGAKVLAKRKGLTTGDHILISRSPMISVVLLRVVITDRAPIGTYLVSDWDWHRGNEGDGDGDPSAGLLVPEEHVDEVRQALRTSYFGVQGYYDAWGSKNFIDLPIMDFYRGGDKKALAYLDDNFEMQLVKHEGVNSTPVVEAVSILKRIGVHYTRFVGKAFAMASALTFKVEYLQAVELMRDNAEVYGFDDEQVAEMDRMLEAGVGYGSACAKIWRRVYEGLALSGISDKAEQFAQYIQQIGGAGGFRLYQKKGETRLQKLAFDAGMAFEIFPDREDPEQELAIINDEFAVYLAFYMSDITLTIEEAKAIYWAIRVTALYTRIERMDAGEGSDLETVFSTFTSELPEHLQDVVDDALHYGTLRRAGAGMSKRPGTNMAMVKLVDASQFDDYAPELSIMGGIFSEAGRVQRQAEDLRANMQWA